jgi:hypothetical protein
MKIDVSTIPVKYKNIEFLGRDLPLETQDVLRHVIDLREQAEELEFKQQQIGVAQAAMTQALDALVEDFANKQEAG